MLYHLLDQTPHAAVVTDMGVPGLPLDYCNAGFAALTAWPCEEAIGHNCRFLQDQRTEPEALAALITAIRTYSPLRLAISNARKDGSRFVNDLSVHPIFDTNGACRFLIGVLADAANSATEAASLQALRQALPSQPVHSSLFPQTASKFEAVAAQEQWKEFQKVNTKLVRLLWATDPEGALRQLLAMQPAMAQQAMTSLFDFFAKNGRIDDQTLLARLVEQQKSGAWSALAGRTAM